MPRDFPAKPHTQHWFRETTLIRARPPLILSYMQSSPHPCHPVGSCHPERQRRIRPSPPVIEWYVRSGHRPLLTYHSITFAKHRRC